MTMLGVWIAALVVFLILEGITAGLCSIWFAAGALCALLVALFHGSLPIQVVVFVAVSVFALWITRPLAKKYINSRTVPTNADRVIGKQGVVQENINNLEATGSVRVEGETWKARSLTGAAISQGSVVAVRKIEGVKLLVVPVEAEMES